MSISLDYQSLGIQRTGGEVNIPDNKLAKLMYYLDCVFSVLDIKEYSFYTKFYNYRLLNKNQEQFVLDLVGKFNPTFMLNNYLFVLDEKLVDYGFTNQFYRVTDKKIKIHANSQVFIGGKSVTVLKIMYCKPAWFNQFYYDPLSLYHTNNRSDKNYFCAKKCIKCLCWFVYAAVIITIIYFVLKFLYEKFIE